MTQLESVPVPPARQMTDQVERLRGFVRRHPYVTVTRPDRSGGQFRAAWMDGTGAPEFTVEYVSLTAYDLGRLLDRLERRFG